MKFPSKLSCGMHKFDGMHVYIGQDDRSDNNIPHFVISDGGTVIETSCFDYGPRMLEVFTAEHRTLEQSIADVSVFLDMFWNHDHDSIAHYAPIALRQKFPPSPDSVVFASNGIGVLDNGTIVAIYKYENTESPVSAIMECEKYSLEALVLELHGIAV